MEKFWEVIYDDTSRTFDVIGQSTNDTLLTNNTCLMQDAGMKVRCSSGDVSVPENEITVSGYTREKGLYNRLLSEYENKTGKVAKRW